MKNLFMALLASTCNSELDSELHLYLTESPGQRKSYRSQVALLAEDDFLKPAE